MTVHTPESSAAELTAALEFVQQKYGTNPEKMIMNRHTRDELLQLSGCGDVNVLDEGATWANIPVKIDQTKDNHVIEFIMPETATKIPGEMSGITVSEGDITNESSLPVELVQSQG